MHNALLSVKVLQSYSDCNKLSRSGRHAQAMSPGMTHADQQECTMHSCRSKFRIQVMNAEQYAILGDMHRQCLPEWDTATVRSAYYHQKFKKKTFFFFLWRKMYLFFSKFSKYDFFGRLFQNFNMINMSYFMFSIWESAYFWVLSKIEKWEYLGT